MIRYIKKNKILFCFTLIINLLTCLTPLFLAYIIENVSGIFLNQDESKITVSLWLIIAFMIYQALFSYLNSRHKAKYRQKLRADLSKDIYRSIFNQNHNEFYENSIGSYLSLFTNDVKMVDDNYFFPFLSMITQCVVFLCICFYLIHVNWTVFFMMDLIAIFTIAVPRLFAKILKKSSNQLSEQSQEYNSKLRELFQCFDIIQDYRVLPHYIRKGEENIDNYENKCFHFNFFTQLNTTYANSVAAIGQMCFILALAILSSKGYFSATYFMSVVTLSNNFIDCLYTMASYYGNFVAIKGINERLIRMIDKKETEKTLLISEKQNKVCFEHVSFEFPNKEAIFKDFSFQFDKGKKYAIVGDSGSGKSTLLKLILGYYSIQKGRIISFDKEPVIIRQEEHLFSGTIRENLCLGENFSEEDLISAMEFANISDLDLNQFVSEDAGNLSGGQIQRISIARAKLHCHNLLLCDEITSSLDSINTEKIERNIIELTDKTIIYVTHKIHKKMLQEFDDILVLSHGKLVEHGSFEDLLSKKNYFYHLFMNQ